MTPEPASSRSPTRQSPLYEPGWGLILTGGANWGAVQVGVVAALLERGFRPECIVGVSVGAINGAFLAARPSPAGVRELAELWKEADAARIFGTRFALVRELATVVFRESSVFSNRALRSFLERSLPEQSFEGTDIPLVLVASELKSGTPRLLSTGDLVQAVLASAALPGLFPSVEIEGERLVDGAITDPLPVSVLLDQGIRRIVVVEAGRSCGCGTDFRRASALFRRAVSVVMSARMDLLYRLVPEDVELLTLGSVCHPETPLTDLSDTPLRIRLGYTDAVRRLGGPSSPAPGSGVWMGEAESRRTVPDRPGQRTARGPNSSRSSA